MATLVETTMGFGRQLQAIWANMKPMQRVPLILITTAVFAGLVVFSYQAGNPDLDVLYTNLSAADAGEVTQALREKGISYKLADEGKTILVPKNEVYQHRLDLAAQGLPAGGVVGLEIFDTVSFGQTDFEREVNFQRALQGELVRTIRELDVVEDAWVHIALPEKSAFLREAGKATAAVMLRLKPGIYNLKQSQVMGIAHLVARSVEGLQPEDVVIVDSNSNVLSESQVAAEAMAGSAVMERWQVQRAGAKDLEDRIRRNLEAVYGAGKVVVMANADINFDIMEETREIYEPAQPGGLIRQQTTEQSSDAVPVSVGVAGSADAENALAGGVDAAGRFQRATGTVEYENNRTVQHRVVSPGQINSLSLTVLIDGALTTADRARIEAVVTTLAAGATGGRTQPLIAVESMSFQGMQSNWPASDAEPAPAANNLQPWLIAGAGVLLLVLLVTTILSRRRQPHIDITVGQEQMAAATEAESQAVAKQEKENERQQLEIESLAKQRPAEFASLVRTWLSEES